MIQRQSLGLNRIARPRGSLSEFFSLAGRLGLTNAELRNDLDGGDPVDGLEPADVRRMASDNGVRIVTLNAVQQFDLYDSVESVDESVRSLVHLAAQIDCPAVVLCPNNDTSDDRSADQVFRDIAGFLSEYGTLFQDNGITGLIEPLGFPQSSLRFKQTASKAIEESGRAEFRIVHDTFHHYLAADRLEDDAVPADRVGLVHLSGVEERRAKNRYSDEDRVLLTERDVMDNRRQAEILAERGYEGVYSFEPFSPAVQSLGDNEFARAVEQSLRQLGVESA